MRTRRPIRRLGTNRTDACRGGVPGQPRARVPAPSGAARRSPPQPLRPALERHDGRQPAFTHGTNFAGRISAAGFKWSAAGENIATGYPTPARWSRAGWPARGTARTSSTRPIAHVGTGVNRRPVAGYASGPATWTQDFGLSIGSRAPRATGARRTTARTDASCRYGAAVPATSSARASASKGAGVSRRYHSASSAAWQPGAGRGHGLAVGVVDEVAGGEHARQVGQRRPALGDDVAVLVDVDLALRPAGTAGSWPIAMNAPVDRAAPRSSPVSVLRSAAIAERRRCRRRGTRSMTYGVMPLDVGDLSRALEHDLRRAELVAAVDDRDLGGELREEHRLLHRRVAAADDDRRRRP